MSNVRNKAAPHPFAQTYILCCIYAVEEQEQATCVFPFLQIYGVLPSLSAGLGHLKTSCHIERTARSLYETEPWDWLLVAAYRLDGNKWQIGWDSRAPGFFFFPRCSLAMQTDRLSGQDLVPCKRACITTMEYYECEAYARITERIHERIGPELLCVRDRVLRMPYCLWQKNKTKSKMRHV